MDARLRPQFEAVAEARKVPGIAAIALDRSGDVLFKGVFGTTNNDDSSAAALTPTTPIIIWSCTKLVTSVAALQLLEQGKLALDDPVEGYVPQIKEIQVLEGFKDDGSPILRAPKTKATILMLMTHTAGFTYDFFGSKHLRLAQLRQTATVRLHRRRRHGELHHTSRLRPRCQIHLRRQH